MQANKKKKKKSNFMGNLIKGKKEKEEKNWNDFFHLSLISPF